MTKSQMKRKSSPRRTPEARFWEKVRVENITDPNSCWLWTGSTSPKGYPRMYLDGGPVNVHRWAYERYVGPIPEDKELDHVRANGCRHTNCVNFDQHLEPVTHRENLARGIGGPRRLARLNASKTHCKHNHAFDSENTIIDKHGHRICRACKKRWNARRSLKR